MSALAKLTKAKRLAEGAAPIAALGDGRRRQQRGHDALHGAEALIDAAVRAGCHANDEAQVLRCEERLRARLGVPAVVAVSSAAMAVRGVLELLGLPPGAEVIVPALGTITTPFAVSDAFAVDADGRFVKPGLVPVFVDVHPATYTIDPGAVAAAITDKTRAIVVSHLFGQPAEMRALRALAATHELALIEDVVHGLGARRSDPLDNRSSEAGALADLGCVALGVDGRAGAVTMTSQALARVTRAPARLRAWRDPGRAAAAGVEPQAWGVPARMDACAAAECLGELAALDEHIARRAAIAQRYSAALPPELSAPFVRPGGRHSFDHYVVRAAGPQARADLRDRLAAAGIATHTPFALAPAHPVYADGAQRCRVSELNAAPMLARTLLALPCYAELSETEIDRIERALAGPPPRDGLHESCEPESPRLEPV